MESVSSGTPTDAHRLVPLCVLLPDGDGTCCAGLLLLVVPLGPGRSCTLVDGGCEDTDCDEVDGLVNFTESGVLQQERGRKYSIYMQHQSGNV